MATDRDLHLERCKQRALAYVARGELLSAVTSMGSDLLKHADFRHPTTDTMLLVGALFEVPKGADAVRRWIEGFR